MTDQELDEWIITKVDSRMIMAKMVDARVTGVGVHFFVNLLTDIGWPLESALNRVRDSLMRLLRAERIFAVGINSWNTTRISVTTERLKNMQDAIEGKVAYTFDLMPR